ncbi:multidrug resistance protein MATE family protein [Dioscorea alata]|uniref:Multidrug resistance protein MATE family protein n=1 Tax=Dioscorea alata TaxID=55571 RepID=A0ACB7U2Z1_DIOAL|nr:multidrug resistance protein MATE family protein [Dioscorea alata]
MILTNLLLYGRSAISMLFMGQLGKLALAGGSLSIGFANITGFSILSGLSSGLEPISSQAYGARRWHLLGLAFQRTVSILTAATLTISLLWFHSGYILRLCGQDPAIAAVSSSYLLFSIPVLFLQSFITPMKIYLRTQNITAPLTIAAALALALHAPINFILVHHLRLGVRGVALATFFSDANFLIFIIIYLAITGLHRKTWPGWSLSQSFTEWRPILKLAVPSCISVCLEWWWYELMIVFSGLLSNAPDAVAAMGILIQTTSLVYIFPSALSLAVSTRVGNELGAGRPDRARTATRVALLLAVATGAAAACFTVSARHTWGRAFTGDNAVVALTAAVLPVLGLCELGNCPQTTGCGALRGSARPALGANINLGAFYGVGMPVAMVLGFVMDMGLVGMWMGLVAAQGTCAFLMSYVLMRTDWCLEAKRARELISSEDCACVLGEDDDDDADDDDSSSSSSSSGSSGSSRTSSSSVLIDKGREAREETEALISVKILE